MRKHCNFFEKYDSFFADASNDTRGILGKMSIEASIPYDEFKKDIQACENVFILVYYYHPEHPYTWRDPAEFPFTEEYGAGPNDRPWIIKRTLDWHAVPEAAKSYAPMCFTILKRGFEITILVFREYPETKIVK